MESPAACGVFQCLDILFGRMASCYTVAMKRYIGIAGAVGVFACTAFAQANHSWGGYHWARTGNPFTVKLGDNVSPAWDAFLAAAAGDWNSSAVLDTPVVAGQSNPKNCRATMGRVEVCNSKYGKTGWLGIAQVWASGSHITQGTAKLNDTYFMTAKYNTPAWKQFVVCQEVGHTFGLDHQDEDFANPNLGTCMDYTSDPARNDGAGDNMRPNAHDYEELAAVYAHLDSVAAASDPIQPPPAAVIPDFSDPSEWGRAIRNGKDGRPILHVRDLGRGQKLFTFVIWADGSQ